MPPEAEFDTEASAAIKTGVSQHSGIGCSLDNVSQRDLPDDTRIRVKPCTQELDLSTQCADDEYSLVHLCVNLADLEM